MNKFRFILILLLSSSTLFAVTKSRLKPATVSTIVLSAADQQKFDYYFYEAIRQRQLGQLDQTVELLTKCYNINPSSAVVMYEFAMAYRYIQDFKHALPFMTKAVQNDPSNMWYKIGLADLYIKINNFNDAILVYEDILSQHPEREDTDFALASLYSQTNQNAKAIMALDRLEKKVGVNQQISFEKIRLYANDNNPKKADNELKKLIDEYPFEYQFRIIRGSYLLEQGENKLALECYNEVAKLDPHNTELLLAMYGYFKKTGETEKANDFISTAFSNPAIDVDTKLAVLTEFLSEENQSIELADTIFKSLVAQYPKNEVIRAYYASFLLMQRKYSDAIPELQFMLDLNPTNKEGWLELVKVRFHLNDYSEIILLTDSAIKYHPDEVTFYYFRGIALSQKERFDEALEVYEKGISTVGETNNALKAELLMYKADIYAQRKKLTLALATYQEAYVLDEKNMTLLNNYAYYLAVCNKNLKIAEEMSAKAVLAQPDNVSFLDTYAWVYFKQSNILLAKTFIEKALDKGGSKSAVVMEHYGDILYMNNNKEEAKRWWLLSKEAGNNEPLLMEKITKGEYIPEICTE